MFVLTIDQKNSRNSPDLVPELLTLLADLPAELPFERSVGDEVQGVLSRPGAAVEAALRALRDGRWSVGIGVGPVDRPLPATSREASGDAFVAAREAVERAKKTGDRPPVAVCGPPGDTGAEAADAEAVLVLLGRLIRDRTPDQWRILEQVRPGTWGAQTEAARRLGITSQSVSKAIARSGWQEEWAARPAAAALLARADQAAEAGPVDAEARDATEET